MKIPDALHVEVVERLQLDSVFGARAAQNYLSALRMTRSCRVVDIEIDASCEIERRAQLRVRNGAELVPSRAIGIFIAVAMRADVLKIAWRPQPVELAHHGRRRRHSRRILGADSAHAPRTIARTPHSRRLGVVSLATDSQAPAVSAMLREARQIHDEPRAS